MKDRTHDISLIDYHVKDIETLGKILNHAAAAAFPKSGSSHYCDVYVLLLSWEDDNLGVATEIDELEKVFRDIFNYQVDRWKIPSHKSHNALVYHLMRSLGNFESNDKLFIVYYGGHGFMNDDRQCVWLSNQQPGAATLQWSSIQTMLEEAECDALVLLDCCAAASSGGNQGKGVTEVIAACGFEAFAPGVGEHSFTTSLIGELRYLSQRCDTISTALLHNKVLARIKKSWNPRYSSDGTEERRSTPIHIADDSRQRCIKLAPLRRWSAANSSLYSMQPSSSHSSDISPSISEDIDMLGSDETNPSSLSEVWPDSEFNSPKVIISVALQEDQRLNTEDWLDWLKAVPALAKLVHVEGVYKSDSTLLLLSLPVALWDMIPNNVAMSFVAFVRSANLLNPCHGDGQKHVDRSKSFPQPQAISHTLKPLPIYNTFQDYQDQENSSYYAAIFSHGNSYAPNNPAGSSLYAYPGADSLDASPVYNRWYPPPLSLPMSTTSIKDENELATAPSSEKSATHPSKATAYLCLHPGCRRGFARAYDLERHLKTHFLDSGLDKLDCPEGANWGLW